MLHYYHICPRCGNEEICITQWAKVSHNYRHICSKCGLHFKAERKKKECDVNQIIMGKRRMGMSSYLEQISKQYADNAMIDLFGSSKEVPP